MAPSKRLLRPYFETGNDKLKVAAAKTGYTCISASIQDSKEISEANPMFSGSGNSMVLLVMLCLETGSEKFKMAAAKPELHVDTCNSIQDSEKVHRVFRVRKLNDAMKMLDVEAKVTHMTIKCCIPFSKLHAW
jgi:hypothetical protein